MRFLVTNKHNGQQYPAEGQHWPEHGWSIQIHDLSPETWGRSTTGVGMGSVIDQGFQEELEKRGWEIPPDIGDEFSARDYVLGRSSPPKNVRDQELKRLAQSFMKKPTQEAKPVKVPNYRRNPETDPHLPHTTKFQRRDDLQIPPEAQAVIDQQWPEVVRTFQQYDQGSGMLMLYGLVRDACKAAGWPDSMAYQMRDHLIAKMNDAKVQTYTGTDDSPGEFKKFRMGEAVDPLGVQAPRQRVKIPPPHFCECGDPGCPVCHGKCRKPARTTVYRSDMEDEMGTPMCEGCAADCVESGVFYTKESVGYQLVNKLIDDDDAPSAANLIEALKPRANVKGVSNWEKRAGRKVEGEHATDNKTRDTIASQHHKERKDYYKKLKQSGLAPELSIEPLKEPPGSPADLKLKSPPPKAAFYPSNDGPSSL